MVKVLDSPIRGGLLGTLGFILVFEEYYTTQKNVKVQNKTKTVKIFKFSVLYYPYLAFVVLSKQQLTTSFPFCGGVTRLVVYKNYLEKSNLLDAISATMGLKQVSR